MLERRDYFARPFSTVIEKNAQLLRDEHNRINAERRARGQKKLLLKDLAGKWDVSQGLVSQYYRGAEPLNVKWQMRFAEWLGVSPAKIWPEFPHKGMVAGQLPPELMSLVESLAMYDEEQIEALQKLVNATVKKRRT